MAPSPVSNIEPKGPDKSAEKCLEGASHRNKHTMSKDNNGSTSNDKSAVGSINIHEIEEAGLKSLLDEAYSYKSPKDRVGKSPLFQELLNEVEESDAGGKKKLIDRSRGFGDGLKGASTIESGSGGHDTAGDKGFFSNILGGCERGGNSSSSSDKKKKKNGKRESSSSAGGSGGGSGSTRRPKFTHSLKINHGPQAAFVYNGSGSTAGASTNSCHGGSRSLCRTQQSLSARLSSSKAALLTSSSNIDIPMVTTYNKQPIMTPAVVPRKQQKSELLMFDLHNQKESSGGEESPSKTKKNNNNNNNNSSSNDNNNEIELKVLNDVCSFNYTTHASLEIGGNGFEANASQQPDMEEKCNISNDMSTTCCAESSAVLMNGDEEKSSQHSIIYKSLNGTSDIVEDSNNGIMNENDEEKQSTKTFEGTSSTDVVTASGTPSVDESAVARNNLLQKNVQSMSTITNTTLKVHTESGYPLSWPISGLFVLSGDSAGRSYHTKESLEKKSGDENTSYLKDGSNRDRLEERKLKVRKAKKPDKNTILSESIAGHCGDKSISYLLEYIESNHAIGVNTSINHSFSGGQKNRTKSVSGVVTKQEKPPKGKACTDEDIRNKKPPKAKDRLKKSTSLEDIRHNRSKSQKKQSSVDDNHYTRDEGTATTAAAATSVVPTPLVPSTSAANPPATGPLLQSPVLVDETPLYFDSLIDDDDNYTETEFHLVTKKHRKKKRRSKSRAAEQRAAGKSSLSQGFLPHNYTDRNHDNGGFKRSTHSTENRHRSRRKSVSSVVPSDKISDSDSIHSLPVSSTTPKCKIKKKSTSSGCTPQASYADIAKSPQCQSSMTLNGDSGGGGTQAAKRFSNPKSPNAVHSTVDVSASGSSDHSDNAELVSTKYGDHVELDDSCDQLLLNSSNNLSHNSSGASTASSSGSESPTSVNNRVDEVKSNDNLINNNNNNNNNINTGSNDNYYVKDKNIVNDSNNNNDINNGDITRIEVTLKRNNHNNIKNNKTSNKHNESDNIKSIININNIHNHNDVSQSCVNGKLEKPVAAVTTTTTTTMNTSSETNQSSTKTKKSKNKKKSNSDEQDVTECPASTSINNICTSNGSASKQQQQKKNGNDLFVEFTLKCGPAVKTKCSETQTDLVEVNNNACCNDVSIEETVVLKNHRNPVAVGPATFADVALSQVDKLSTSLPIDEAGTRVVVLPAREQGGKNKVSIGFNVNEKLLQSAAVTENRTDVLKMVEHGTKYNVGEVIQYVNKSWNEVMESLSSTKVNDTKTKVQYYVAK